MLPPKNGKPITFKPTKELREQTEAIADSLGKSLSDYIRIAVESYNAQQEPYPEFNAKMKAVTEKYGLDTMVGEILPAQIEFKNKVKPTMVQTFTKGVGKK